MSKFTHLHVHTEFSLLDGLAKIPELMRRASELGMDALAITDHGSMYGAIKFYQEGVKEGIKPIIGVETYLAKRSRFDKQGGIDIDPYHLVLLAKNQTGYQNLLKIVTISHLEGFYYKPRIDNEVLKKYHEGIIATSACLQGEIASLLLNGEDKKAKERALFYEEVFGEGNFYLEIQKHPQIPDQEVINKKIIKLGKELGLPLVATNDSHYVKKEDAEAQEILLCVQTQRTLLDKNRPLSMISSPDFYLKSPEEMDEQFKETPEALENTIRISQQCHLEIVTGKWILPLFTVPEGETPESYLRKNCYEKIKVKFKKTTDEIKNRLEYELDIIEKKGYAAYFLIVADFVNWAKGKEIAVGPGRGSAAGSLVAYLLNITGLDPFYFKLPFERFLNPFRPSPPDIDLDFADNRRDEVIAYVTQKYGDDKVAQIITFGTMEARQAIRDVGRVLGMPYSGPDRIAKMIPPGAQGAPMSIEKALLISPELSTAYETEEETKNLLDLASKLEGVARHSSTHAAGVVIADKKLSEYTPLQRESKGDKIITQYDMYTIGEAGIGLLKMDFLGLRNLTIIQETLKLIKETENKEIDLNLIPIDDEKTYKLLSSGETVGIFQLESAGMRRYIKELKPTSIFDLMAMVALFRPGPMKVIPEFIARKHNADLISYPHPKLKEVLKESYGLITYQDDVLLTSIVLAGYSWGDADKLRKAVGKKIPSEMKKQKDKFIAGCVNNSIAKEKAEEIFKLIEPFAGYGFNKAHAACYALIAYQTAYLKSNYPEEFMTALLSAEAKNSGPIRDEKLGRAVRECRNLGIPIMLPDVNASNSNFSIERKGKDKIIRFGFSAIKNLGPAAIDTIIGERNKNGIYKNIFDFVSRVDLSKVNKKTIESLIKSGALDIFGKRAGILSSMDDILEKAHSSKKIRDDGQVSLFGKEEGTTENLKLKEVDEFSKEEILAFERDLLGFYFSDPPYLSRLQKIKQAASHQLGELTIEEHSGQRVKVGGFIRQIKKILTKNGSNEMAFVQLEDTTGSIETVVFPKIYSDTKDYWQNDNVIIVEGKINDRQDRLSLIVEKVYNIDESLPNNDEEADIYEIRLPANTTREKLERLKKLLHDNPGNDRICLILEGVDSERRIDINFGVSLTRELKENLDDIIKM